MAGFDPVTGKLVDPEALKSLVFNPVGMTVPHSKVVDDKKVTEILDDSSGRKMAESTEHKSGRVDANVFPEPATTSTRGGY